MRIVLARALLQHWVYQFLSATIISLVMRFVWKTFFFLEKSGILIIKLCTNHSMEMTVALKGYSRKGLTFSTFEALSWPLL